MDQETDMINYICEENKAFFRSQQIDEPDLTLCERKTIVKGVLEKSLKLFLYRFGQHLKFEHLAYFNGKDYPSDDTYEINHLLKKLTITLSKDQQQNIIKNRRFMALQKMISSGNEYFSEKEMMQRQPYLYQQLIGQYMTDNERNLRDRLNAATEEHLIDIQMGGGGYSKVLFNSIDQDHMKALQKQQEQAKYLYDSDSDDSTDGDRNNIKCKTSSTYNNEDIMIYENYYPHVPPSFRKHWGDFEDESSAPCTIITRSTNICTEIKNSNIIKQKRNYITAIEKDSLKHEFIDQMYSSFLLGKDVEFDYTHIDNNAEYDDIAIEDQDKEEQYFDLKDVDETTENNNSNKDNDNIEENTEIVSGEEDELDIYMKEIYAKCK